MVQIVREKYWMVVILVAAIATATTAQNQPCIQELAPCADYVYFTRPPPSCCNPLKKVVTEEVPCLCAAFQDPTISSAITFNDGLELVKHCNITGVSPSLCSVAPPTGFNGNNAVQRTMAIGIPGFLGFLSFFWSIMA